MPELGKRQSTEQSPNDTRERGRSKKENIPNNREKRGENLCMWKKSSTFAAVFENRLFMKRRYETLELPVTLVQDKTIESKAKSKSLFLGIAHSNK